MKKMTTNEIRQAWLNFFKVHNHLELPSRSLIPVNDPSLLWINSGVATLKPFFSGIETPPNNRLVNSQKAIRTNDITNVGVTARHHTFFEMLGNFSIGDYFKKEAIQYAYDLLVNHFQIDPTLLYITVYEADQEAYEYWLNLKIDPSHIIRGNKTRNFWDVGQGPCGPCTEIYYDRGNQYDPENIGVKLFQADIENDRYVEIWNIVFSQFNNDGQGNYTELARKNIDTGAGLERLAAISQQVPTDFDTDAFLPIMQAIGNLTTKRYDVQAYFSKNLEQLAINRDFKIIADHFKACTFAIADGAIPTNKERGSILRRLIRRAMISARRLAIKENFSEPVVIAIITAMSEYYPYLQNNRDRIIQILTKEERLFNQTLERGFKLFDEIISQKHFHIDEIFKLVDTYGFPFELIVELAKERGVTINEADYERKLQAHQDISRGTFETKGMLSQNENLILFDKPSIFDYDQTKVTAKVIGLFNEAFAPVSSLTHHKGWVVFDCTVFYATSGGQQHDLGYFIHHHHKHQVLDVIKGPNGQHFHLVDLSPNSFNLGDSCELHIDLETRKRISRNHSVEHLIQHALQTVIDPNIRQEGAFKSADKVTFDFQYHHKLTDAQIIKVQDEVNKYINNALPIVTHMMHLDEAKQSGAIAWFDDVYRKIKGKLRVVCMGDVSKEICGGTHVANTKDIEAFLIVRIDNKGGGAWRLEGLTSQDTISQYLINQISIIQNDINKMCEDVGKVQVFDDTFNVLVKEANYHVSPTGLLKLRRQLEKIQSAYHIIMAEAHKKHAYNQKNIIKKLPQEISRSQQVLYAIYQNGDNKTINQALTELTNQDNNHAYLLINETVTKLQYVVVASKPFVEKYQFDANHIVNKINQLTNGSGGGHKHFAQGGTSQMNQLPTIIDFVKSL